ncbi:hypothetical protein ES705_43853 [subsurface metagenome]
MNRGLKESDLQIFNNNTYWKAFYDYIYISGKKIEKIVKNGLHKELIKFNAIIDIAFSVPIFPYYSYITLPWQDYYPVERFYKLCHINSGIDIIDDLEDNENYHKYVENLCSEASWPTPNDISNYYLENQFNRIIQFGKKWEKNSIAISNFHMYDYYLYLFSKFSELRINNPSLISNYGINCFGELASKSIEYRLGDHNDWFTCPMQKIITNNHLQTTLKDKQYSWLLTRILHNSIIRDGIMQSKRINKII